jgi:c-di-GMP-binding flagellar brake protein YcgR
MPEHLRKIASRLRELVADRRRSPRYRVSLPVSVSLLDAEASAEPALVQGRTRDVSSDGIGVILPNIRVGGRYLVGDSVTLRVMLKLPESYARLYGTPVRYEKLETAGDKGFLVGIRLTETSERDQALLINYIKGLKK